MKKTLFIAVFSALIFPTLTYASVWWQPWTWFATSSNYQPQEVLGTSTTDIATSSNSTSEQTAIEKPIYKDKVVTRTITVQDPALQTKIDALVTENNNLKIQISDLNNQISLLKNQINSLNNSITAKTITPSSPVDTFTTINSITTGIDYLLQKCRTDKINIMNDKTIADDQKLSKVNQISIDCQTKITDLQNQLKTLQNN